MPISLYDAFVPSVRQIIASITKIVDKAEAYANANGLSAEEVANWTLHESMLPLKNQIHWVASHGFASIEALASGLYDPMAGKVPANFDEMREILAAADAGLAGVDPATLEAAMGKEVVFAFGEMRLPFTAENFLLSFSQPNFYFHATTAYDILRAKGVELGKTDFMGRIRLKLG